MRQPGNVDVIQAIAAIGQLALAGMLILFTAYSVQLSRKTFAAYRREQLDATLPVLVFQIWPNEPDDINVFQTDIRVVNGGTGVALNISPQWEPASSVELVPSFPPTALLIGEDFRLTLRGSAFLTMFHDGYFGGGPERKDETGRTLMRLGTLRAQYRDLHGREVISVVHVEVGYIDLDESRDSPLGGKRMTRQAALSGLTLSVMEFIPPSNQLSGRAHRHQSSHAAVGDGGGGA
jgi:hypothetical protein